MGLPAHGAHNWDGDLNNFISGVAADAAQAKAASDGAQSHALYARTLAQSVAETMRSGITVPLTEDPADPGTYLIKSQAFVTEDASDPGTFLIGVKA